MKRSLIAFVTSLVLFVVPALAWQQPAPPADDKAPAEAPKDKKPEEGEKPKGTEVAAPVDPNSYLIGPEDVVLIRVWREQDLSGLHAVRPDGKITLPLVGDLVAGGQTLEQLKATVIKALSEVMVNPQVSVSVTQVNSKKYYLTGEIARTGVFPLITPITIMEAISQAGGFKEFANRKKVIIWRKGKQIRFNYDEVIEGKNLQQNILLESGDHIIVR